MVTPCSPPLTSSRDITRLKLRKAVARRQFLLLMLNSSSTFVYPLDWLMPLHPFSDCWNTFSRTNLVHWWHTYIQYHFWRPPQSCITSFAGPIVAHLKIQINKCQFAKNSVEFLVHLITPKGIGPNKTNIEVVTSFPTPSKVKSVCAFLGLCNYYRRFIKNYSILADPLLQLLKKNATFHEHSPQHESFMALKERLTTSPILVYPDFSILFTLYTDASGDSIGFNLTQNQHGHERVILYGVQNFLDTEKKYCVTEWEALSVILAIQKCRPYLLGNHFTVVVDHQALKRLMNLRNPTGRLARWALTLQVYDFNIQYWLVLYYVLTWS